MFVPFCFELFVRVSVFFRFLAFDGARRYALFIRLFQIFQNECTLGGRINEGRTKPAIIHFNFYHRNGSKQLIVIFLFVSNTTISAKNASTAKGSGNHGKNVFCSKIICSATLFSDRRHRPKITVKK